jgi:hypothetical protein
MVYFLPFGTARQTRGNEVCSTRQCSAEVIGYETDMDLIRDLLLCVEAGPEMDGAREFMYDSPEDLEISILRAG